MVGDATGIKLYVAMQSVWDKRIPKGLAGVDPDLLIRLLELADCKDGITQETLETGLRVSQSRLSKLKDKLVAAKWVKVWKPADRRKLLMRTAPQAQEFLSEMRSALAALIPSPKSRRPTRSRGLARPQGVASIFDHLPIPASIEL